MTAEGRGSWTVRVIQGGGIYWNRSPVVPPCSSCKPTEFRGGEVSFQMLQGELAMIGSSKCTLSHRSPTPVQLPRHCWGHCWERPSSYCSPSPSQKGALKHWAHSYCFRREKAWVRRFKSEKELAPVMVKVNRVIWASLGEGDLGLS